MRRKNVPSVAQWQVAFDLKKYKIRQAVGITQKWNCIVRVRGTALPVVRLQEVQRESQRRRTQSNRRWRECESGAPPPPIRRCSSPFWYRSWPLLVSSLSSRLLLLSPSAILLLLTIIIFIEVTTVIAAIT